MTMKQAEQSYKTKNQFASMANLLKTNPDVFSKGDVDRQQYLDSTLYND